MNPPLGSKNQDDVSAKPVVTLKHYNPAGGGENTLPRRSKNIDSLVNPGSTPRFVPVRVLVPIGYGRAIYWHQETLGYEKAGDNEQEKPHAYAFGD